MDTSRKKYDFVYNFTAAGKNITEVINVKERGNQLFKDKFVLVMLVLGLLTIVAAAGAVRIQKGRENIGESPYLEIEDPDHVIAGDSNAGAESGGDTLAGELAASGDEAGNGELAGDGTAVGLADNENGAGTGADPGIFAGEISMDTGLADASDSALTGGHHDLLPDSGPVQSQPRQCDPERGQHPGIRSGGRQSGLCWDKRGDR